MDLLDFMDCQMYYFIGFMVNNTRFKCDR